MLCKFIDCLLLVRVVLHRNERVAYMSAQIMQMLSTRHDCLNSGYTFFSVYKARANKFSSIQCKLIDELVNPHSHGDLSHVGVHTGVQRNGMTDLRQTGFIVKTSTTLTHKQ